MMLRTTLIALTAGTILPLTTAPHSGANEPAPALVQGHITDATGASASGVDVQAWAAGPRSARHDAEDIKIVPLGSARTDADGSYSLEPDGSIDLAELADAGGILTLFVTAIDGDRAQRHRIQLQIEPGSSTSQWKILEDAAGAPSSASTRPDPQHAAPTVDIDLGNEQTTLRATPADGSRTTAQSGVALAGEVVADYGPRAVFVGQFVSLMDGVTARFEYETGATSTLGIATSLTGTPGSFTAGATKTVSAMTTTGWDSEGQVFERYRTQYRYGLVKYTILGEGDQTWTVYEVEPLFHEGGADRYTEGTIPWPKQCVPHEPHTDFVLDVSEAHTFDYGVATSGMIDLSLSARSGFSSKVRHEIDFQRAGFLCGLDSPPGDSRGDGPRVISADHTDRSPERSVARTPTTISADDLDR